MDTIGQLYDQVVLTCVATGNPTPTITWYKDDEVVTDFDGNFFQFTITELSLEQRGFYHCEASNVVDGSKMVATSPTVIVNIDGKRICSTVLEGL